MAHFAHSIERTKRLRIFRQTDFTGTPKTFIHRADLTTAISGLSNSKTGELPAKCAKVGSRHQLVASVRSFSSR